MKRLIIPILLLLGSLVLYYFLPNIGLYSICIVVFILTIYFVTIKLHFKLLMATLLSGMVFLSLISKTYERQGWKMVHLLFDYYHDNKEVPKSLDKNVFWKINSYTPMFDKYQYDCRYDSLAHFFFQLKYRDIWGRDYFYCDKCGEFEIERKPSH